MSPTDFRRNETTVTVDRTDGPGRHGAGGQLNESRMSSRCVNCNSHPLFIQRFVRVYLYLFVRVQFQSDAACVSIIEWRKFQQVFNRNFLRNGTYKRWNSKCSVRETSGDRIMMELLIQQTVSATFSQFSSRVYPHFLSLSSSTAPGIYYIPGNEMKNHRPASCCFYAFQTFTVVGKGVIFIHISRYTFFPRSCIFMGTRASGRR